MTYLPSFRARIFRRIVNPTFDSNEFRDSARTRRMYAFLFTRYVFPRMTTVPPASLARWGPVVWISKEFKRFAARFIFGRSPLLTLSEYLSTCPSESKNPRRKPALHSIVLPIVTAISSIGLRRNCWSKRLDTWVLHACLAAYHLTFGGGRWRYYAEASRKLFRKLLVGNLKLDCITVVSTYAGCSITDCCSDDIP